MPLLLAGCGVLTPPDTDTRAWGIPYTAQIVPAGSLPPPLVGLTIGYRVQVDVRYAQNTFIVAHELTHVWQWQRRRLMAEWSGVSCTVQTAARCSGREAHADAVAMAVLRAGCLPGDLGWPGGAVTGCALPDPAQILPPQRPP